MARHIQELILNSVGLSIERSIIPDAGTSVVVEYYTGTEWVADTRSPITTPNQLVCKGLSVRLTPNMGGFFIDEGVYT